MRLRFLLMFIGIFCKIYAQYNYNQGKVLQEHYLEGIPFEFRGKLMTIQVGIDGRLENFIFDTGAPNLLYKDKIPGNKWKIKDFNGNLSAISPETVIRYQLGKIEFQNIPFVLMKDGSSFFEECLAVKGFIGSNGLRNSVLKIDYNRRKIIISDDIKNFDLANYEERNLIKSPKKQMLPYISVMIGKTEIYAELDSGFSGDLRISERDVQRLEKSGKFQKLSLGKAMAQSESAEKASWKTFQK